jgi:hypothetical protein
MGKLKYVSVKRRAEIGERKIKILLGNFRRSSAYFRGIRDSLNFNLLERHPIPVDIITKNCSRNQRIL